MLLHMPIKEKYIPLISVCQNAKLLNGITYEHHCHEYADGQILLVFRK